MIEYTPFPISNARTGLNESVEPWLLPRDGYQSLLNCHFYRGVLEKIGGYNIYAKFTKRQIVSLGTPDGVTTVFTVTLNPIPSTSNILIYGTLVIGVSALIISTYSSSLGTVVTYTGPGGSATIDLSTGVTVVTFSSPPIAAIVGGVTFGCVFIEYDAVPDVITSIMGIKPYYASNGSQDIIVFDELRVGKIVNNVGLFESNSKAPQAISQLPVDFYKSAFFTGDGVNVAFAGSLPAGAFPFVRGTLSIIEYAPTGAPAIPARILQDNTFGFITATTGAALSLGLVNYVTGKTAIVFTVAPVLGNYFDLTTGVYTVLFTGGISNFFSTVNYQYKLFFTNGVDPIFYYDGMGVHYLNTNLSVKVVVSTAGVPAYDITTALHVYINQQRLLLINVTAEGIMQVSTVYWSTVLEPLNFTNDESLTASTSQPIRAIGTINTDLIIRFSNSERVFRYVGDPTAPFRFDTTNIIWACDAIYSTINYDTWFSTVGRPAIVGSDGVNVRRVDEAIPDFTDPSRINDQTPVPFMSQTSIGQGYGERFDDIKEGWLCYNSQPAAENQITISDNVLAFNYLDSTYAIYTFPFTCLGLGRVINLPTWGTIPLTWDQAEFTWDSYDNTNNALLDLAGDGFDTVYELNTGSTQGDGVTPVFMSAITKNFNPFIEQGQLARFGYIDIFVSADVLSILRVQFYVNDQLYVDASGNPAGYYQETILNFTPTDAMSPNTDQIKVWKRIYVGSVAKEHTIRFYQNAADFTADTLAQPIFIHAIVPYFKPAGRIFN